jgi:hypothetical protein
MCRNQATWIVSTDYGKYHLCSRCKKESHLNHSKAYPIKTDRSCECENLRHHPK